MGQTYIVGFYFIRCYWFHMASFFRILQNREFKHKEEQFKEKRDLKIEFGRKIKEFKKEHDKQFTEMIEEFKSKIACAKAGTFHIQVVLDEN